MECFGADRGSGGLVMVLHIVFGPAVLLLLLYCSPFMQEFPGGDQYRHMGGLLQIMVFLFVLRLWNSPYYRI